MSASQEEDKEKEDEKLDLVLGELVKIINDSEDEIHYRTRYNLQCNNQIEVDTNGPVQPLPRHPSRRRQ